MHLLQNSSFINCYYCVGSIVGQALTDHMDVRKIGFTGSTDVGKGIMQRYVLINALCSHVLLLIIVHVFINSCAVSNAKRVSLELGGKSPLIVFGDCDMDKAVRQVPILILIPILLLLT